MNKTKVHECELLQNQNFTSVLQLKLGWYFVDNETTIAHTIKYCPYCGKELAYHGYEDGE